MTDKSLIRFKTLIWASVVCSKHILTNLDHKYLLPWKWRDFKDVFLLHLIFFFVLLLKQHYLSHSSGGWEVKIKAPADAGVMKSVTSWFMDSCLLIVPLHGRRGRGCLQGLSKGINSVSWGLSSCDLINSHRPHLLILSCAHLPCCCWVAMSNSLRPEGL